MKSINNIIVLRLRELADKKGISLYKLQIDSGMPKGTFLSLIYGKRKGLNITTLFTLLQTLQVSPKEFFDTPQFDLTNLNVD